MTMILFTAFVVVMASGLSNQQVSGLIVEATGNTTGIDTCHDVSSECDLLDKTLYICNNIGDALKLCKQYCNLCDYECKDTSHECMLLQETIGICGHVDQALQLCKHHCNLCYMGPKPTTEWPPMIVAGATSPSTVQTWKIVCAVQIVLGSMHSILWN